jgi:RecJ-like exonuclease
MGFRPGTEDRCRDCKGKGSQVTMTDCTVCNARGFCHDRAVKEHDTPENIRCFYCQDCLSCKGKKQVPEKLDTLYLSVELRKSLEHTIAL